MAEVTARSNGKMRSKAEPDYPPPAENLILSELAEARRHARITNYRLISISPRDLVPRDNIAWLTNKEFIDWKRDLIEAWKLRPSSIPPIVVARDQGEWAILDGHHRWRAVIIARRDPIWVIQVRGKLLLPGYREKQQRE